MEQIYKKQWGVGEMMTAAWDFLTKYWKQLSIITLIVYVPINIILEFIPFEKLVTEYGELRSIRYYANISQFLELLIGIIAAMAIALFIKAKIDQKKIDYKQALLKAVKKWPHAIGTSLLTGIFLIGLFLLIIIPGIIFYVYWIFIVEVVILEKKYFWNAMKHSKSVVKGRWWSVFGIALLFGLLAALIGAVTGGILGFVPDNFILNIIANTIIDLVLVYFTILWIIFYINYNANKVEKSESK